MKANELRIGNWYDNNSNYCKVTTNTIESVFESERVWCKPIPITVDIVLKCGFEFVNKPNQYGWYKTVDNRNLCWCHSDFVSLEHITGIEGFNDTLFDFDCKYLHQLQNIYFTLTNTELNIDFK